MEIRGVPTLNGKVRSTIPFCFFEPFPKTLRYSEVILQEISNVATAIQTTSSNMQQCKYAKCAKSAKYFSSDIQRGRCPPQPTQTTVSTSSPKPLMSLEWPSVAASQGSQPACSWKKPFSPNFSGMGWPHSRQNQETYSPSTLLKQEKRSKRNGKNKMGGFEGLTIP